jgi:hypothetical protein
VPYAAYIADQVAAPVADADLQQPVKSHNQLLRHGMLSWVTGGVYLGYQRNDLELHWTDLTYEHERHGRLCAE